MLARMYRLVFDKEELVQEERDFKEGTKNRKKREESMKLTFYLGLRMANLYTDKKDPDHEKHKKYQGVYGECLRIIGEKEDLKKWLKRF